jgi:hypothetical protein
MLSRNFDNIETGIRQMHHASSIEFEELMAAANKGDEALPEAIHD